MVYVMLTYLKHVYFFSTTVKKEKAEFLKKPDNVEVTEEEDVRFETTVSAIPEPTIEW